MARRKTDAANPNDRWERHWERYADSTRANPGQILRRRLITRLLGDVGSDARILDLGCGSGDLLAALAETYPEAEFAGADQGRCRRRLDAGSRGVLSGRSARRDRQPADRQEQQDTAAYSPASHHWPATRASRCGHPAQFFTRYSSGRNIKESLSPADM